MPRFFDSPPKYRKHRATGQAIVTLSGKMFYLGPYGTKTSHLEYDRLIAEWLQNGRCWPESQDDLTVVEMLAAYKRFAESYYVKNGKPTREVGCFSEAAQFAIDLYGLTPAAEFGPKSLQVVQRKMIEAGWSRGVINKQTDRIKRAFKWAVAQELIPALTLQALLAVPGLRKGRTAARETAPVMPVDDAIVDATLAHLPQVAADMVCFQRLTGCRPGEVCAIRPCDVNTDGDVWEYHVEGHKMEHTGRARIVFIGPRAQEILRPYLLREPTYRGKSAYCFSPQDSERERRREQHEQRKTPLHWGNRPGTNRKDKPARPPGNRYTVASYRRAIERACDLAFPPPPPLAQRADETARQWQERLTEEQRQELARWQSAQRWAPNRLRHSAATEIRKRFGLEAAQVTLGHASADVTQVYAERDLQKAAEVMRQVG